MHLEPTVDLFLTGDDEEARKWGARRFMRAIALSALVAGLTGSVSA